MTYDYSVHTHFRNSELTKFLRLDKQKDISLNGFLSVAKSNDAKTTGFCS